MIIEYGGLAVRPRSMGYDISVTDRGDKSVTVNLTDICLYDSSATGDCPSAGTVVSCCTVTAAGVRCEFVASNFQLHSCRTLLTMLG